MPKTKTKPPFTLAVPEEPEDEALKAQVFEAMGATPEPQALTPEVLIAQAIQKNVPVETMERLLAMRRELKAEWAKEQFDAAMAKFQGECPVIKKTKAGGKTKSGQIAYYYAPLDSIVAETKDLIQQNGFSYAIQTHTGTNEVKVTCVVKHMAGHSESSDVQVPLPAKTDIMSAPQVVASALTFAKRYAFCNAFGILTGDEDTDAQEPPQKAPVRTARATTKPARNPAPTKREKTDRELIRDYLLELGVDYKNLEQSKAMVRSITELELEEKNYPKIVGRLWVRVKEQREAKVEAERLKGMNAAAPKA